MSESKSNTLPVFFWVTSLEDLRVENLRVLGVRGLFPSGYLPATNGEKVKNSLKYGLKKRP